MASTKALSEELLDSKGTFIRTMKLTNRLQSTLHSNTQQNPKFLARQNFLFQAQNCLK
jgi:hypothetical protein